MSTITDVSQQTKSSWTSHKTSIHKSHCALALVAGQPTKEEAVVQYQAEGARERQRTEVQGLAWAAQTGLVQY